MPVFRARERTLPMSPRLQREIGRGRPKRYLVLGSAGHGRGVACFLWDKAPTGLNVADYDVVVLNFSAFEDQEFGEGFPPEPLPSVESMTRLMFSPNAEIVDR